MWHLKYVEEIKQNEMSNQTCYIYDKENKFMSNYFAVTTDLLFHYQLYITYNIEHRPIISQPVM